jgi:hypothetical protein
MTRPCRRFVGAAAIALIALSLFPACSSDDPQIPKEPLLSRGETGTWVAAEPTQCLTNSWEQDWLERHDWDYAGYPKDPTHPGLEPEEVEVITDYYSRQGVVVSEATTRDQYQAVCLACSCPEGHTMYLRIRDEDVQTMLGFGYRVESPRN